MRRLALQARGELERAHLGTEVTSDTVRLITKQLLSEMNGSLTIQEKRDLLTHSDKTLLLWYEREANQNRQAYRSVLVLQGTCKRPPENR